MSFRLVFSAVWRNEGNRGQRLQRSLAALRWQVRKRLRPAPVFLHLPNGMKFTAHPDCVVSSALIYMEWPEYDELVFLRRMLRSGQIVIDVGANVGHFSLLLADVVGPEQVYAFEPVPVSFQRLQQNWMLNGWETVRLFPFAVGVQTGSVRVPDTQSPVTTNSVIDPSSSLPSIEVSLVSLDSMRHNWKGREVGLLKVDVEGYEREVFQGAERLLAEERPRLVMFESLKGKLDADIRAVFAREEYTVFQLTAGSPDFSRDAAQNLFAVPAERRSEVEAFACGAF